MAKYKRKHFDTAAFTFHEFVEFGLDQENASIVDGIPLSFTFLGFPVTHENDDLYLINIHGVDIRFNRDQMLVVTMGTFYPMHIDVFNELYEVDDA